MSRNPSFLSRDIEARRSTDSPSMPTKTVSPPEFTTPNKESSPPKTPVLSREVPRSILQTSSPPKKGSIKLTSLATSQIVKKPSPAVFERSSSIKKTVESKTSNSPVVPLPLPKTKTNESTSALKSSPSPPDDLPPPPIELVNLETVTSPPLQLKSNESQSKSDRNMHAKTLKRDDSIVREIPPKIEKLTLVAPEIEQNKTETRPVNESTNESKEEESNGVGDKIKKFEKAAEEATVGRLSRPGSMRRPRVSRLSSDAKDESPSVSSPAPQSDRINFVSSRWQPTNGDRPRPEPQKIIKPEFRQTAVTSEITIRSPSLGAKIADRFPSRDTAFRNVAGPDGNRTRDQSDDDTEARSKTSVQRRDTRHSVSKGSSYFTRGSEEIWLVKKKDIEEIEERVFDSFRRAGACVRNEGPVQGAAAQGCTGQGGAAQGCAVQGGTMRPRRHAYGRSESLEAHWAGTRAHTLKRQASVACTCGHDRKPRPRATPDTPVRTRSRSHGDENNQSQVLDKYETLV